MDCLVASRLAMIATVSVLFLSLCRTNYLHPHCEPGEGGHGKHSILVQFQFPEILTTFDRLK